MDSKIRMRCPNCEATAAGAPERFEGPIKCPKCKTEGVWQRVADAQPEQTEEPKAPPEKKKKRKKKKAPTCKVCDDGKLTRARIHRMSSPVVIIGYILLLPTVIGTIGGLCIIVMGAATGTAAGVAGASSEGTSSEVDSTVREALEEAKIPISIIEKVVDQKPITKAERGSLTKDQVETVDVAETAIKVGEAADTIATAGVIGASGFAVGFGIFLIVLSFVNGLVGWLLIMKKDVLLCNQCGATVDAA